MNTKTIKNIFQQNCIEVIQKIYNITFENVEIQTTKDDFEGELTLVVFPLLKLIKGNPTEIATKIGEELVLKYSEIKSFNVIQGFLNVSFSDSFFITQLNHLEKIQEILLMYNNKAVEYKKMNR